MKCLFSPKAGQETKEAAGKWKCQCPNDYVFDHQGSTISAKELGPSEMRAQRPVSSKEGNERIEDAEEEREANPNSDERNEFDGFEGENIG